MFSQTLSHEMPFSVSLSHANEVRYVKDINSSFCRFCAQEKNSEHLLNLDNHKDTYNRYLKAIDLLKIDFLDLSEYNKLPKTTCTPCYNSFIYMYNFFDQLKKAQVYLNTVVAPIVKEEISYITSIKLESYSEDETNSVTEPEITLKSDPKIFIQENLPTISIKIELPSQEDTLKHNEDSESNSSDTESNTKYSLLGLPSYCGVPIFQDETETKEEAIEEMTEIRKEVNAQKEIREVKEDWTHSWSKYKWQCYHCKEQLDSMEEVRSHSKISHDMCYGFSCSDCDDVFNTFNAFVEHARQHREFLRYYCQYCNTKFESRSECFDHTTTHWEGTQKICNLCGEIFPDQDTLERHKNIYKKVPLSKKLKRRKPKVVDHSFLYRRLSVSNRTVLNTWESYTWSCQECCQRFPNVAILRRHTQEVHKKCFSMKCTDCLTVMTNYKMFVDHVTQHRPSLKNFCQFCNAHIEDEVLMNQHVQHHLSSPQKPCDGCGQIFENNKELLKHMREFDAPRLKGTLTPEDVTCDICNKFCYSLARFRQHRKKHDSNRQRPFVCDTCGKAFLTQSTLMGHVKLHDTKSEICKICKRAFHSKQNLKSHITTHSESRPFKCDECGKDFRTKARLKYHLVSHSDVKAYACKECDKTFKFIGNLKVHQHQHTGVKPYACEVCDKTFGNWANCNKHMIRKHGITLAKTKRTPQGRVAINRALGKPQTLSTGKKVKEGMDTLPIDGDKRSKKQ